MLISWYCTLIDDSSESFNILAFWFPQHIKLFESCLCITLIVLSCMRSWFPILSVFLVLRKVCCTVKNQYEDCLSWRKHFPSCNPIDHYTFVVPRLITIFIMIFIMLFFNIIIHIDKLSILISIHERKLNKIHIFFFIFKHSLIHNTKPYIHCNSNMATFLWNWKIALPVLWVTNFV